MKKGQDVNLIWECLDVVAQVPAADVAPVVHGKWEYDGTKTKCSVCGDIIELEDCKRWDSNYCSDCGAKMDL